MPRRTRDDMKSPADGTPLPDRRWLERLAAVPGLGAPPEGMSEEECWSPKPCEPADWSDLLVADRYEHFEMPPGCPRFRVPHAPRAPWQSEAQYEADRRSTEQFYFALSICLGIAQQAATVVGLHRSCPRNPCRRAGQCVSRRAEDDWTVFPGPMLPPCCNDRARTELVRHMVNVKLEQIREERGGEEP
ncbi:hypothetical protein [Kumtagia ephedrae]|nr:hypothetical protein [Mesorhizobium ephedrae]